LASAYGKLSPVVAQSRHYTGVPTHLDPPRRIDHHRGFANQKPQQRARKRMNKLPGFGLIERARALAPRSSARQRRRQGSGQIDSNIAALSRSVIPPPGTNRLA
jgi:hypothetical protein